jgi:hypothetical protein
MPSAGGSQLVLDASFLRRPQDAGRKFHAHARGDHEAEPFLLVQDAVEDAFDECDRVGVSMGPGVETPAELLAAAKALRGASDEEIEKVLASIPASGAGMRIRIPDAPCMSEEPDDGPKP